MEYQKHSHTENVNQAKEEFNVKPTLYPNWKQAAEKAINEFTYGDFIPYEWLRDTMDLPLPKGNIPYNKHQEYQLKWLGAKEKFKNWLLEEHQMDLQNVRGGGYTIMQPKDQSSIAYRTLGNGLKKNLKKATRSLLNVNSSLLTTEQRRDNANKLAITASLNAMTTKKLNERW